MINGLKNIIKCCQQMSVDILILRFIYSKKHIKDKLKSEVEIKMIY